MSIPSTVTVLNLMAISFRGPPWRSIRLGTIAGIELHYSIRRNYGPERRLARIRDRGEPAELRRLCPCAPALAPVDHARGGRARAAAGRPAAESHHPVC